MGFGRPWGVPGQFKTPPSDVDAQAFLDAALKAGIKVFDTAKAYGKSEERLGKWLFSLDPNVRSHIFVATKVGEFWNNERGWINHEAASMKGALASSVGRLGKISLLQIHQADVAFENPRAMAVIQKILDYSVQQYEIPFFGASVKTLAAAKTTIYDPRFTHLQVPRDLYLQLGAKELHDAASMTIMVNRPFGQGSLAKQSEGQNPFEQILQVPFDGNLIVLTGTSNAAHLRQNNNAFSAATNNLA